ncbi:MAG TPA: prolyl oligopeptidase family serine peptidase [Telluria sp.]|jgi:acetyl esterase/lipase
MFLRLTWSLTLVLLSGPIAAQAATPTGASALTQARIGFKTELVRPGDKEPAVPAPPKGVLNLVRFESPVGRLAAYVTPDPGDGKKHPAIVWITGGDSNSLGEMWSPKPRGDDQSAAAYRKAGVVTMFPSLRGGNDNPGKREGYLGEIDDVIAAANYLASLPYVDPHRIYLGGHSTGGTIAMLVAESTSMFQAVFAFGPVSNPNNYGTSLIYHSPDNARESALRSPIGWMDSVKRPLFVLEGAMDGNMDDLREMAKANKNPMIRFLPVPRKSHFSILAPANELIASKILTQPEIAPEKMLTEADALAIGTR